MSTSGLGRHGKLAPSGSFETLPRALSEMVSPVLASMRTNDGMPRTPKRFERASLRLSPCGIASHGIVP